MILPYLKAGGTERQAAYIVNYLQRNGHNVDTISVENLDFFEQYFQTPVHYLNSRNSIPFLLSNILSVTSLIKKKNTDVLISRAWSTNLLCSLVSLFTGVPNVLFLSASLDMSDHNFIKKIIYRFVLRKADHIISVSDATKRNCIKWFGVEEKRISVIHNGVDVKNIQKLSKEKLELPNQTLNETDKKLVFVGRLINRKGLDLLLKAIKHLDKDYSFKLIVVGGGSLVNHYKQMCKDFNIESNVLFLGEKKNPFPYLKLGDIFILPSRSEGFPNVLLEAMAMGKTVIAANCKNGPNEIIDNSNGTLVEVNNPNEIADTIIHYFENQDLAKMHAYNAKKTVEHSFKLNSQLSKIEKVITAVNK